MDDIQRRLIAEGGIGGAFDLEIVSQRRMCRFISRVASWRSRFFRLPYGDQGIFVWRQVFEALGGYPDIPIMEDIALGRRLRRSGRMVFLSHGLFTNPRRWHANGVLKTTLANWFVTVLFFLAAPPRRLRRLYDRMLVSGMPSTESQPVVPQHR